ncbi:Fic family protein [Ammoniphilus sp. YIM 78166]|uniref:Fic family protein n=1 Tax=Ammoniphilus sp. YIM 78166 TaxID=1644106 RepID=UPI0010704CEB|nr:Fic family protein [Ammoniphilus sp. YIM 78166]
MSNELLVRLRKISYRCDARELAEKVHEVYFADTDPTFPIDIFKMLKDFGLQYRFMQLENLEGMYSSDRKGYVPFVAINSNRRYGRQRFTAAHELCHHLRDYDVDDASVSPINSKDPKEATANKFAAELLMPRKYFIQEAERFLDQKGFVPPENALYLCNIFGTSFESVIWNLHHNRLLEFEPSDEFFYDFKPERRMEELSLNTLSGNYLRNIIDSYCYIPQSDISPLWLRFQNELVYHDNRIEGLEIELNKVAEICTDLRLFQHKSRYYTDYRENKSIVETVGHSFVYQYLVNNEQMPDRYLIRELHRNLFQLAPNQDVIGEFRKSDNEITGSHILTVHHSLVDQEMYLLDKDIEALYKEMGHLPFSHVLERATIIHHTMTKIHPFNDGNGRLSRALLNTILKAKGLPPIFIQSDSKPRYLEALFKADGWVFTDLIEFFLERLLSSMIYLNSKASLIAPVKGFRDQFA